MIRHILCKLGLHDTFIVRRYVNGNRKDVWYLCGFCDYYVYFKNCPKTPAETEYLHYRSLTEKN